MVTHKNLRMFATHLFFILFGAFLLGGCGDGNGDHAPAFETTLHLHNTSDEEVAHFASGEPIKFTLSIRNLTDAHQTITLPSAQVYDFLVFRADGGPILYQWSHLKGFAATSTGLHFVPYETKSFSEVWHQKDNDGILVGSGDYKAIGFIATSENIILGDLEPAETRSTFVPFSIE